MPLFASAVNIFWRNSRHIQAQRLCLSVLNQARLTIFYEKWGVPDTLEGRFDCACLHMALLLKYLKGPLAQNVFDAFFAYTELTLREVGVGDLNVGKQIKKCAKFFYGALKAYHDTLENKGDLKEALARNLYGGIAPHCFQDLITYVKACESILRTQDFEKTSALKWPTRLRKKVNKA